MLTPRVLHWAEPELGASTAVPPSPWWEGGMRMPSWDRGRVVLAEGLDCEVGVILVGPSSGRNGGPPRGACACLPAGKQVLGREIAKCIIFASLLPSYTC